MQTKKQKMNDVKDRSSSGPMYFKSFPPNVVIEMHFCTVMADEQEAMRAMLSFLKACKETWGDSFEQKFLTALEQL